jgi:mono/diheme cytochrome c family protein
MKRAGLLVIAGCMTAGAVSADDMEAGRQLFEARCGVGCHQLPEPGSLKASQWPRVLETMQKRMRQFGMPPLDAAEYDAVLKYLVAHARSEP